MINIYYTLHGDNSDLGDGTLIVSSIVNDFTTLNLVKVQYVVSVFHVQSAKLARVPRRLERGLSQ